jgi:hypothetical protein
MLNMAKISILCGNYGSGKTEIALNMAMKNNEGTTLIDLDIVNPYFRSSEHREMLEKKGVQVISPNFAETLVDIPSLPANISAAFGQKNQIIMDVGGTEVGAVALGRYSADIIATGYEMGLVVNANRPFSSNADEVVELARLMEDRSRLKFTYIINNTNVALETVVDDIIAGQKICDQVAEILNLPVSQVWAMEQFISRLPDNMRDIAQPIELFMRPEWL